MNKAFDVDDILADFNSMFMLFYNEKYKTNFKREDFFSASYYDVLNVPKEEAEKIINYFYTTNYFKEISPMVNSFYALSEIKKKGHNLFVITGRRYALVEETKLWIEKHFPGIFSGIYHTNSYCSTGVRLLKSQVCIDINANSIVDDDMIHIFDCASKGIKVFVYDHPWNRKSLPENTVRFFDWKEIVELI